MSNSPRRIAIIGNAGAGKSTLAQAMGKQMQLEVVHLDQILWKPDWGRCEEDEFNRLHQELLKKESWIIEGWAYESSIAPRFAAADTIVYIDLPLWLHYWRVFKRQIRYLVSPNPYLPEGCPMVKRSRYFAQVVWRIHRTLRPRLWSLLMEAENRRKLVHLRSPGEVSRFLSNLCAFREKGA